MKRRRSAAAVLSLLVCAGQSAYAHPYKLQYGGRLTQANGQPLAGTVSITASFYPSSTGGSSVASQTFSSIPLSDGIFNLTIELTPAEFHSVFSASEVWIEITDTTSGKIYPRQRFTAVPFAFKVPVDGVSLGYDNNGQMRVQGLAGHALPSGSPADGQILKWRSATGWEWGSDDAGTASGPIDSIAIQDGSISNVDIASNAAIAGTKIAPNFGSQNITTTGVISGNGSGLTNLPAGPLGSSIDSSEIVDGTIADADISATAAIAQSKVSGLTAALAGKEPAITAGTASQYLKGDKSWATLDTSAVPENTNLYYTDARARAALSGSGPIAYNSSTGVFSIPVATSVADGYLSSSDWLSFSNKQAAITAASTVNTGTLTTALQNALQVKPFGSSAGEGGELRFMEVTGAGSNYVGFKAPNSIGVNKIWTLPTVDGTNGQVLTTDGSGALFWSTGGGGGGGASGTVTSITAGVGLDGGTITNAGTIDLANTTVTPGSYTRANITVDAQGRLTAAANGSSVALGSDVSGTLPLANGGTGSTTASGARTNLGLGSLATLSAVSTTEITDGTIADADISATAAIAQSKISGLSTSLAGKEPTITAGTGGQYFKGDKTWATLDTAAVPENTNLYYTDARARAALSGTAPVAYNSTSGAISMAAATSVANGYLSSSDWLTFNNKQAAITASSTVNSGTLTSALQNGVQLKPFGSSAGEAGELRFTEVTGAGSNFVGFKAPDSITTDKVWTLPATDGTSGQSLVTNGSGVLSWASGNSGSVTSVATGTGLTGGPITSSGTISLANTAVTAGSYTRANITVDAQGRLTAAANGSSVALGSEVSGTLPVANGGTGATSLTSNGMLFGNGTSALSATAAGSQYNVLTAGAGGTPAFGQVALGQSAAVSGQLGLSNGGTGASTAAGARTNLGLGSLSTLSAVSTSEITDGTIADADISSSAAIAQSKISGLTTSLSGKEPAITAGTASQYFKGDKTWATLDTAAVPENTNLYYTDTRARAALSGTAPVAYNSTTGAFSMASATSVANGYLSSSDWLTFNNKQAAITASSTVNSGTLTSALQNGVQLKPFGSNPGEGGELRFTEVTGAGSNYIGFKAPDSITADKIWTLPAADGTSGQVLSTNGSGVLSWASGNAGTVTSVSAGTGLSGGPITSTGTLSLANTAVTAGSYTRANITVDAQGRLTAAANGSSVALGSEVSGTLPVANGGTGATSLTSKGILYGGGTAAVSATTAGSQYNVLTAGAAGTPAFGQVALDQSAAISGILGVANGGTGLASGTSGGIPYYSAASTIASSGALTSKGIVLGGGAGAAPTSTAALTNGQLLIGSTGANPVPATLSQGTTNGVTVSNGAGTITLDTAQDIRTTASPTFAGLSLTGSFASSTLLAGSSDASATPGAGTIRGANGTGSNISGANVTIAAGNGTGTGGSGSIQFQTAPVGSTGSTANTLATRMTIDKTGNVGIGTTAPAYGLDVIGPSSTTFAVQSSGTWQTGLHIINSSSSADWMLGVGGSGNSSAAAGVGGFGIYGGSTPSFKLNINANGNVGIGTTSPGSRLDVAGEIRTNGITSPGTGTNSERFGSGSSASGWGGTAFGRNATASGNGSVSLGPGSTASGWGSLATGDNSQATGDGSIAIGPSTNAGGGTTGSQGSIAIGNGATVSGSNSIVIGTGATTFHWNTLVVGGASAISNAYFGNGVTAASPSSFTLQATGGSGTDIQGGSLTLAAGKGTGTGGSGSISFQTAPSDGTGSTANTLATRMMIDKNGNVGIGTTIPDKLLSFGYTSSNGGVYKTYNTTEQAGFNWYLPGTSTYQRTLDVVAVGSQDGTNGGGEIRFLTNPQNSDTAVERVKIDRFGNVGIGTTSPGSSQPTIASPGSVLQAAGYISSNRSGDAGFHMYNLGGVGEWYIHQPSHATSDNLLFSKGVSGAMTDYMAITPAGNVGIGTTSPSYTLHVVGTAGLSSGTSWTNASDIRLKDVEGDYEYGLAEVKKLHTIRFRYKKDNPLNLPWSEKHTGFIAQEVREIIPDAVIERADGYLELNVDPIHWATVNAVKELADENDQLKAESAQLKAESAQLKAESAQLKAESAQLKTEAAQLKARADKSEADSDQLRVFLCTQFPSAPICK